MLIPWRVVKTTAPKGPKFSSQSLRKHFNACAPRREVMEGFGVGFPSLFFGGNET